ncbi:MAG: PcfJ domain-containing protein [Coprobacillus sp.]
MRIYKYSVEEELKNLETISRYYFEDYINKITVKYNKLIRFEENKKFKYYCTHCGKWHEDKKVNYKYFKTCPHCHRRFEVITKRNCIKDIEDYITILEINKRNELIIRCFYFRKSYNKETMEFQFNCFEVERINNDQDVYMRMNSYFNSGYIRHSNNSYSLKRDKPSNYYGRKMGDYYFYGFVITKGIKKIIDKTKYKYSCLDVVARKHICILDYLKLYKDYNKVELIVKNGNYRLLIDLVKRGYSTSLLEDKKNYRYLKDDLSLVELENAVNFNLHDLQHIKAYGYVDVKNNLNSIDKLDVNINKLAHYLFKQKQEFNYYQDYYMTAKKLGMPMYCKEVMFPQSLIKSHDHAFEEYKKYEKKINSENIKKFADELKKYEFKEKNLIITPATSQEDLIKESKQLKHCVRDYATRMANKETAIFFIRKSRTQDKPYVTLELNKDRVIQCRGYKNNTKIPLDEKVKSFVNDWCKKFEFKSCFNS